MFWPHRSDSFFNLYESVESEMKLYLTGCLAGLLAVSLSACGGLNGGINSSYGTGGCGGGYSGYKAQARAVAGLIESCLQPNPGYGTTPAYGTGSSVCGGRRTGKIICILANELHTRKSQARGDSVIEVARLHVVAAQSVAVGFDFQQG